MASISGMMRAVRHQRVLDEELGLHRSNRLPWKRIFLESCLRVSQMELTSSWQSDSAVRAHVWKASQWLWQAENRQINVASEMSSPSMLTRACYCGLIHSPAVHFSDGPNKPSSSVQSEWGLITMATASESETISQMILQHSFHQQVQMQIFVFSRLLQGWIGCRTKRKQTEFYYGCSEVINYSTQCLSVSETLIYPAQDHSICSF